MKIRTLTVLSPDRSAESGDFRHKLALARDHMRRLRANEARLRIIIDANADGVLVVTEQGVVRFANPAAELLLGVASTELVGREFGWPMVTDKATEVDVIRRDGEPAVAEMRVVKIKWENEIAFLASFRDITARKHAEQQALDLALERERIHVLTEFIRDASHEFRTPLSIINLALYLLEQGDSPAQRSAHRDKISEQVIRMTELVDALVTMSRLDRYECAHSQQTDLRELIQVIYVMRKAAIAAAGLSVTLDFPQESLQIMGDTDELDIAFKQLIDNAIRFTPRGGSIAIRGYQDGAWAILEIADTGIGISEAALPHIFKRFYRVDTTHTTPGFGLGLPIAKRVIEGHHGRIEVHSALGSGSKFSVFLPRPLL